MKIAFWNTGGKVDQDHIHALVADHSIDILALAEFANRDKDFEFRLAALGFRVARAVGCSRITLITRLKAKEITPRVEADRYTFQEVRIRGQRNVLIGFVHLPSKLHRDDDDQLAITQLVCEDIEKAEKMCGHENTLIIGDFNMNPYDKGMQHAFALNSVSCPIVADRLSRIFQGKKTKGFFYNPSWNLLGDRNSAPGTYYFSPSGVISTYWHALDQVVMRPSLSKKYVRNSLKVVTSCASNSLLSSSGTPKVSDHLPIVLELQ